ncbi:hypothetical protein J6590_057426 [Homalodisca vitripennis]|nr:hypothetical protein J6590_057426 [Homalodisca vitripennis]
MAVTAVSERLGDIGRPFPHRGRLHHEDERHTLCVVTVVRIGPSWPTLWFTISALNTRKSRLPLKPCVERADRFDCVTRIADPNICASRTSRKPGRSGSRDRVG